MNHMSIDLETFSVHPRALVLSIGLTVFSDDPNDPAMFSTVLHPNPRPQLSKRRFISWDTVLWWMDEEKTQARQNTFFTDRPPMSVEEVSKKLSELWGHYHCERVWGYGPTMDITILESLLRENSYYVPWSFRQVRCLRTLSDLYPQVNRPASRVPHEAASDSKAQAQWIRECLLCHRT